ncbi:PPE domain-containing protein [Rhodococcus sovatensis]|uniref:PPE domain-containing protein n=1 Tax=Rhodococcus sovatensis TaxID=1805840 RepID=A0ABZ2PIH1_9NOCA
MTLGVTGVVWLPRTATVNSASLLAGAGPAPLAAASGAWQSVAVAYTDASITVGRVIAVLAAGWEGEAANAAQERLGGFLTWTQSVAAKSAQVSGLAAGEAAAYATAALAMPNPVEIAAVKSAKYTAYSTGGALNGSAEALEVTDRALDIRAAIVMEAYEAATTPLAVQVSFDHPPEIVNDRSVDRYDSEGRPIADSTSYSETDIFGFSTRTSPAQAAVAAATAALQNPALASAAGQIASTAGSVAGSSVTSVASAASNIGSAAASTLMGSGAAGQGGSSAPIRAESTSTGPAATRAVSAGSFASTGGGAGRGNGLGALGSSTLGGPAAGSSGTAGGGERAPGLGSGSLFGGSQPDPAAAARGAHGGAPMGGNQSGGSDDDEHETPGYLRQFEHFADGRTVAPSVIGAEPAWNDR